MSLSLLQQQNRVSSQAFIEEVENWELTLSREHKQLKCMRGSKLRSKIHQNQLEIILTEIEAEMIKYRKLKDIKKINTIDVIEQYNICSRKFMDLMESIGSFAEKIQLDAAMDCGSQDNDTLHFDSVELNQQAPKHAAETFTYKQSKQQKYMVTSNKSSISGMNSKGLSRKQSHKKYSSSKINKMGMNMSYNNNSKTMGMNMSNNSKTAINNTSQSKINRGNHNYNSNQSRSVAINDDQRHDSWEIRYQLKQIKSMMAQIQNQINYHSHEDVQSELNKIQHNNKKMGLQLKALKNDNQYVLGRIQKIKEQLTTEKQIQAQMIEQFEHPNRKSRQSKSISASRTRHNQSQNQDVSQWVKIRI